MSSMFAEYERGGRRDPPLGHADGLTIRPARVSDARELGLLSAERNGGAPALHAASFERWIRAG